MITAWIIGAAAFATVSIFMAGWCYVDPDNEWSDKQQRILVRRWLIGFFSAPVWPLALLGLGLYWLVVLGKFAFPAESEVDHD